MTLLGACASKPTLMQTPNIYASTEKYSEKAIPPIHRKVEMEIVYVTDRGRSPESPLDNHYNAQRSPSMAYGTATVGLSNDSTDWNTLLRNSNLKKREKKLTYFMKDVVEVGRFPASPYAFFRTDSGMQIRADVLQARQKNIDGLRTLLNQKLTSSDSKDVVLFVHGFNNTFNDASFKIAGFWHFLQRQAVPLLYSWPSAKGRLTGYFTDRESGEYTIFHLKETLRILFESSEVKNIHIIAHSRGNDVVTSALRELIIENRAAGGKPREDFRIANLIMAAPDLDFGVIKQRLMAEQFGLAFGQITIYTSEQDRALGLSQWLMKGIRFGRVSSQDIGLNERNIFSSVGNVSLIKTPNSKALIGHNYFHSNPAVSSDIIQLIRHQSKPGSVERPLSPIENNFWLLPKNYLAK